MNRYESYKEVDLPWLKELPSHWEVDKVKRYFEITRGRVISKEELDSKGNYPVYSSQTENFGIIGYLNTYDFDEVNSITWTTDGEKAGTTFLRSGKYNCTNICGMLLPKLDKLKDIDLSYCNYIIGLGNQHTRRKDTNGYKIMNNEMKRNILLLPPLQEQTQIANYLDWKINEIDKLIVKEKEKIRVLQELKQSSIFEFVTKGLSNKTFKVSNVNFLAEIPSHWKESSIRKYASFVRGNTSFTKDDLKNKGDFVALQYGKVYQTEIINDEYIYFVDKSFYNSSQEVNENNIVIVSTSETIDDLGHVAFYYRKDIGLIGGEQILVKPKENIHPKYLFYLLKVLNSELKLCATGMKVYRFKINDLKNIIIPIPSMNEQREIVIQIDMKLSKINNQIILIKSLIEKYSALKQSLISEVVTGQIDVRDVVIPEYEKVNLEIMEDLEKEVEVDD